MSSSADERRVPPSGEGELPASQVDRVYLEGRPRSRSCRWPRPYLARCRRATACFWSNLQLNTETQRVWATSSAARSRWR
ncbi:MAG: hypothetical protein U5K43_04940 [Halofilum sp. (in: g-proteobacteria)]|nr:hypothetical protein [Halofilum sp. (in: g-proteobacteria)]